MNIQSNMSGPIPQPEKRKLFFYRSMSDVHSDIVETRRTGKELDFLLEVVEAKQSESSSIYDMMQGIIF